MADYSIEDVIDFVEDNDVKFIRLAFCDLNGNQKNVSIMPQELREAYETGISFDAFHILGYDDPNYQDLFLRPDLSTLHILPWRPQSGRVIRFYCDIVLSDGTPYPYDCRKFLKDTLKECAELNFDVMTGLKSEFYLFKQDEDGNPTAIPFDNGTYFDVAPADKGENIRREICLTLEEMGIMPESSHHEAGPGQNEIDFAAADALTTADHFVTYKNVVANIAARNGVHASFDPKPIVDKPGNGLHMKVATYRDGKDINETDPAFTESFIAGVLNRMKDITVFLNSCENSYDRFGQNEAPKYITWSAQSRSRLLRVPIVNGKRTCFVLRSPDSSINPYLAIAMVIQAGLEGLRNNEILPPPQDVSTRHLSDKELANLEKLPTTLAEAISFAKDSEFLKGYAVRSMADRYIDVIKKQK